jgi:uncharacterized protein (TIGR02466 family)
MSKVSFHQIFPTNVYLAEEILSKEKNNELYKISLDLEKNISAGGDNWKCNTYTTLGSYNLTQDQNFSELINLTTFHVNNYVALLGSNYKYQCQEAWLNVGYEGSFQEYHVHANSTISCIYYLKMPEGSGRTIFENPVEPDMIPIKFIEDFNIINSMTYSYLPIEGSLLIFRSYLRHMVEQGRNKEPRITIAFNF